MRYTFHDNIAMWAAPREDNRTVTDADLRAEMEFARRNSEPKLKVFTTDEWMTDKMHSSLLKQLNERMRAFWEKHAEGGSL